MRDLAATETFFIVQICARFAEKTAEHNDLGYGVRGGKAFLAKAAKPAKKGGKNEANGVGCSSPLCKIGHDLRNRPRCTKPPYPLTRTGREERTWKERMGARFTPEPDSCISLPADLAISRYESFSGAVWPADEAIKGTNVGKWHSSNFWKVAQRVTGRRHTLAVLLPD